MRLFAQIFEKSIQTVLEKKSFTDFSNFYPDLGMGLGNFHESLHIKKAQWLGDLGDDTLGTDDTTAGVHGLWGAYVYI